MKVLAVVVDKKPTSCGECLFFKSFNFYRTCEILNRRAFGYWLFSDCPLKTKAQYEREVKND